MEQEKTNCKYCNSQINNGTIVCPYCGKSQLEATRKKNFWYIIGLLIVAFIIYFTFTGIVSHEKASEVIIDNKNQIIE